MGIDQPMIPILQLATTIAVIMDLSHRLACKVSAIIHKISKINGRKTAFKHPYQE
jgi:hypothetical protein